MGNYNDLLNILKNTDLESNLAANRNLTFSNKYAQQGYFEALNAKFHQQDLDEKAEARKQEIMNEYQKEHGTPTPPNVDGRKMTLASTGQYDDNAKMIFRWIPEKKLGESDDDYLKFLKDFQTIEDADEDDGLDSGSLIGDESTYNESPEQGDTQEATLVKSEDSKKGISARNDSRDAWEQLDRNRKAVDGFNIAGTTAQTIGNVAQHSVRDYDSQGNAFHTGVSSTLASAQSMTTNPYAKAAILAAQVGEAALQATGAGTTDLSEYKINDDLTSGSYDSTQIGTNNVNKYAHQNAMFNTGKKKAELIAQADKVSTGKSIEEEGLLAQQASTNPNLYTHVQNQLMGNDLQLSIKNGGEIPDNDSKPNVNHHNLIDADDTSFNVIPSGALHAEKHHLGSVDRDYIGLTRNGIPVVSEEQGSLIQHAEIERGEIILRLSLTKKLMELKAKGTYEAAIEAGKLLVDELNNNTRDNVGLIKTLKKLNGQNKGKA